MTWELDLGYISEAYLMKRTVDKTEKLMRSSKRVLGHVATGVCYSLRRRKGFRIPHHNSNPLPCTPRGAVTG